MMYKRLFLFFSLFAILCAALPVSAFAQAVSVDPKRLVFEGRDRSKEVYLMNSGDTEVTYRIFFQEMEMTETGEIKTLQEDAVPEDYPAASKMIRYSPRQVVIPAHGSQVVMFMVRKPKDLADGEYRSHVTFQAVPEDTGESLDDIVLEEGEVGVKITPIFGIAIPVIVRHGDLSAMASMSDLKIEKEDDAQVVTLTVSREGNRSLYGHINALYTPPGGGTEITVGIIKGISVYDGIASRSVTMPLNPPEGVTLEKGGMLTLQFEEDRDMGGDATAEASLTIQ